MPDTHRSLNERIALVTGAGSGIGAAVAAELAQLGCRVLCTDRDLDRVARTVARIGEAAAALELDVTDPESVGSVLDRCPDGWREVDILVNSAGHDVGGRRAFHEGTVDEWVSIVETNVTGLLRVTHAVLPGMVARDHGHIVNIGSLAGIRPYATGTIYSASKHAVHGFSESLRRDYAGTGVRVTELLPGVVRTGFAQARWGDAGRAQEFYEGIGECLAPDDVARSVGFAVAQPDHVVVSALVILPRSQG